MPSFLLRGRQLSSDDAKLNLRTFLKNFGSQAKRVLQGIFYMPNNHTTWSFMTAVDFLNHENPPTWDGVEPSTLGAVGQRQTNYATQSALAELGRVIGLREGGFPFHDISERLSLNISTCNVASPNINSGRLLCWTRHPHVHLAAAAQPLFDPRGIEHRQQEEEICFELTRERWPTDHPLTKYWTLTIYN
ncbi:hypothetical protein TNCV_4548991 [Trichonephila clavipes]|nr:hypothetical protein TNCV_4548991 [Trichonephila clavipes]